MEKTKRTGSGYVMLRTGTEGPREDPYGYEEWTVKRNRMYTTIHVGLAVWLRYGSGKKRQPASGSLYNWSEKHLIARFEKRVGVSLRTLERAMHTQRCKCGERSDFRHESGYPGEHFTVCNKCGEHVDYLFRISEVE